MVENKLPVGALVRISDARDEDTAGVDRQEQDCRELADKLGWRVVVVYTENDTSAFKRKQVRLPDGSTGLRVLRPEFRRALADLDSGAIRGLIGYDLDRVARDPRDLEDLIDVVEQRRVPTRAVTGSLDLSTDAGVTMARVMVAVANKASRDASRRVARKHRELAEQGRWGGGGKRSFGYESDRKTINEAEAEIVRECAQRILDGSSLRAIAMDLTRRGVPTANQSKNSDGIPKGWHSRSVHSVLGNGRVAGLRTFHGEIIGQADWPAILDRDTWDRVQIALAGRKQSGGNKLRKWLSGILLCGQCGRRLYGWSGPRGRGRYVCPKDQRFGGCGRTAIDSIYSESTVAEMVIAYLARPDVIRELSTVSSAESVVEARKSAAEDEAQLAELATLWGRRQLTTAEYLAARKEIDVRLAQWQAVVKSAVPGAARELIRADDLRTAWEELNPHKKRDVVHVVCPYGISVVPPARKFSFDAGRLVRLSEPWLDN